MFKPISYDFATINKGLDNFMSYCNTVVMSRIVSADTSCNNWWDDLSNACWDIMLNAEIMLEGIEAIYYKAVEEETVDRPGLRVIDTKIRIAKQTIISLREYVQRVAESHDSYYENAADFYSLV